MRRYKAVKFSVSKRIHKWKLARKNSIPNFLAGIFSFLVLFFSLHKLVIEFSIACFQSIGCYGSFGWMGG